MERTISCIEASWINEVLYLVYSILSFWSPCGFIRLSLGGSCLHLVCWGQWQQCEWIWWAYCSLAPKQNISSEQLCTGCCPSPYLPTPTKPLPWTIEIWVDCDLWVGNKHTNFESILSRGSPFSLFYHPMGLLRELWNKPILCIKESQCNWDPISGVSWTCAFPTCRFVLPAGEHMC